MPRPQPRSTFNVPQQTPGVSVSPKVQREPAPFVIVPSSLVTGDDRETLEPKWAAAIEIATD